MARDSVESAYSAYAQTARAKGGQMAERDTQAPTGRGPGLRAGCRGDGAQDVERLAAPPGHFTQLQRLPEQICAPSLRRALHAGALCGARRH